MKVLFKIGKHDVTPGRLVIAAVVLVCVPILIHLIWPGKVWHFLFELQGGVIFLGLIVGIFSGVVSALLYGFLQKEVWQDDIREMHLKLLEIDKGLSDQLTKLRNDHDTLLQGFAPAIGGAFTQSLFEYHPMASKQIARILSDHIKDQYARHHSRVVVQTAADQYTIKGLERIESTLVWSLYFHLTWTWKNDSKITKYPLDDFLLVADMNQEALEGLLAKLTSTKKREDAYKERTDFLGKNIVRSIIVNPQRPEIALPPDLFNKVFSIEGVWVGGTEVKKSQLESVPEDGLPKGVYAAWSLPKDDPAFNPALLIDDSLTVEYSGHLCLAAPEEGKDTYSGYMTFPPSDVISDGYELTLGFPRTLEFEGTELHLEVVEKRSGCRFIHGPLKSQPRQGDGLGGLREAEMKVSEPLTELHEISLVWTGKK